MDLKKDENSNKQTKNSRVPMEVKVMSTIISNNALQQFMRNMCEATLLFDVFTDLQYF